MNNDWTEDRMSHIRQAPGHPSLSRPGRRFKNLALSSFDGAGHSIIVAGAIGGSAFHAFLNPLQPVPTPTLP
jgi:hypothetical protein